MNKTSAPNSKWFKGPAKHVYALAFFFAGIYPVVAQPINPESVDSLRSYIISKVSSNKTTSSDLKLLFRLIAVSRNPKEFCGNRRILAQYYFRNSRYDSAFVPLKEALSMATLNKLDTMEAYILNDLARIETEKQNFDSTFYYLQRSLEIREKLHIQKATVYVNIGDCLTYLGRESEAAEYCLKGYDEAIREAELSSGTTKRQFIETSMMAACNAGIYLSNSGNTQKARAVLARIQSNIRSYGKENYSLLCVYFAALTEIEIGEKNWNSAQSLAIKCWDNSIKCNNDRIAVQAEGYLLRIDQEGHAKLNNFKRGIPILDSCLSLYCLRQNPLLRSYILKRATIYYTLTNNTALSSKYAKLAIHAESQSDSTLAKANKTMESYGSFELGNVHLDSLYQLIKLKEALKQEEQQAKISYWIFLSGIMVLAVVSWLLLRHQKNH